VNGCIQFRGLVNSGRHPRVAPCDASAPHEAITIEEMIQRLKSQGSIWASNQSGLDHGDHRIISGAAAGFSGPSGTKCPGPKTGTRLQNPRPVSRVRQPKANR